MRMCLSINCHNLSLQWLYETGQFIWKVERAPLRGEQPQGPLIRVCGCIFSWPFQWDYRRPCPTSAARDITNLVLKSSVGGLRGLWSGSVGCLSIFSWWLQGHHRQPFPTLAAPSSLGGGPIGPHVCYHMRLYTLTSTCGGKGGNKKLTSSPGGDHL